MGKPALHTTPKGKHYWEHRPSEFMMSKVNDERSFIEEFGWCKKYNVLRIKFRQSQATYQYFMVPMYIMKDLRWFNNTRQLDKFRGMFRDYIHSRFTYLQEGTTNQLELNFDYGKEES